MYSLTGPNKMYETLQINSVLPPSAHVPFCPLKVYQKKLFSVHTPDVWGEPFRACLFPSNLF